MLVCPRLLYVSSNVCEDPAGDLPLRTSPRNASLEKPEEGQDDHYDDDEPDDVDDGIHGCSFRWLTNSGAGDAGRRPIRRGAGHQSLVIRRPDIYGENRKSRARRGAHP
jgi:hypothetical protein